MRYAEEKAKRIMAEIIGYFLDNGLHRMEIQMTPGDDGYHITVSGPADSEPADLKEFRKALSDGVQPEMEEYYMQLLNMSSGKEHHFLLGAMVDEAEVVFENGILCVSVIKKNTSRQNR